MNKILILEDDTLFAETLGDVVENLECTAILAADSEQAMDLTYEHHCILYLLDVKVPGINGFDFLYELRQSGDETPAMFITSLRDKESLSKGFQAGCDDFLRKPVDIEELEHRIKAILKRTGALRSSIYIGEKRFEPQNHRVFDTEEVYDIKPQESLLLEMLVRNQGRIVEKTAIYEQIWEGEEHDGTLRVYITTLKKIFGKDSITNIRGVGYRFES